MTDSYGIPIFEGDVIYQEYWLENMKLDMWHFVCWDEKLGCFIARCCNQDGVAEYDDPYDRNGYAPMLREWVEEKTVIGNIHCVECDLNASIKSNPNLSCPTAKPDSREDFWNFYYKNGFEKTFKKYYNKIIIKKIKRRIMNKDEVL